MKNLFSNIRGDAFGGITAGIVALPLALAFGVSSGLGPSAGLYGGDFYQFFCSAFWWNKHTNFWTNSANDSCFYGHYCWNNCS